MTRGLQLARSVGMLVIAYGVAYAASWAFSLLAVEVERSIRRRS